MSYLNTPEARRRAADIDQKYGTEYNKVYDKLTKEYEDITSYVNMVEPEFVKDPDAFARIKPVLKIHNKPSILFKDFKNRPLVNNTTKDKNKELV